MIDSMDRSTKCGVSTKNTTNGPKEFAGKVIFASYGQPLTSCSSLSIGSACSVFLTFAMQNRKGLAALQVKDIRRI